LAQRLVRVLCEECKVEDTSAAAAAFKEQVGIPAETRIFKSTGCRRCRQTGFYGRHAIFEWMDTTNEIREMILKHASSDVIAAAARRGGMHSLADDGWRLVAKGITTAEEVLSVTTAKEVQISSVPKPREAEKPT
jgi:type II secretory ATPase GspE/PulE/Tfp pilus assembly ATPase PilB-like protein